MNLLTRLHHSRKFRNTLRIGTELANKIPVRGDGAIGTLVKLLAAADSIEKAYAPNTSVLDDMKVEYDLVETNSRSLVAMFFNTGVAALFSKKRHVVDDEHTLIEVDFGDGVRVFFEEYNYTSASMSPTFYCTKNFDPRVLANAVWKLHAGGLYMGLEHERSAQSQGGMRDLTLPVSSPPATTRSRAALKEIAASCFWPHSFIIYGPPGTGKSSMVAAVAAQLGRGLLKIDSSVVSLLNVDELLTIVSSMRPGVVLLDDFDQAPISMARPRVLHLLENLSADSGVNVFMTVNDASALDPAMLRSQRIDEAIEMSLPDDEERAELLGGGDTGVDETVGWSHADVVGLRRHAARLGLPEALRRLNMLRALAAAAEAK